MVETDISVRLNWSKLLTALKSNISTANYYDLSHKVVTFWSQTTLKNRTTTPRLQCKTEVGLRNCIEVQVQNCSKPRIRRNMTIYLVTETYKSNQN